MAELSHLDKLRPEQARWLMALGACLTLIAWQFLMPRSRHRAKRPILASAERHPQVLAATEPDDADKPKTAFEPTDWQLGPIALIYIGLIALLVIVPFVLIAAYPTSLPDVDRSLSITPPGPRLETNPQADLQRFRAEEEKRLNTYYWVDRQKGIVHIPIEQAMKKLATTGAPGFPKGQQ
jgi:hypothetical protein